MLTTDLSIFEISNNIGYKALANFYTIFKKIKGSSPAEFRKRYGGKDDEIE